MGKLIQANELGEYFHKTVRTVQSKIGDEDVVHEVLEKNRIEVMPEDAGVAAFYEVGFNDGYLSLNDEETGSHDYNTYMVHNKAEFEYLFIKAGNKRGARACIKNAYDSLLKLVK